MVTKAFNKVRRTVGLGGSDKPVIAAIRLQGVIAAPTRFRSSLSLATMAPIIERAFSVKRAKVVALLINSPGGSPVQAQLLTDRIRALAKEKDKRVIAFTEDVAASGGYMLACAADEIFAHPSSIVGSIGVISAGFGFEGLIKKIGVERRIYAAGENKGMLDPFQPERPEDVDRLKGLQLEIHELFKDLVRKSRGIRLTGAEDEIFSGAFWTGGIAEKLGLVDGIGDARTILRDRYGANVKIKMLTPRSGIRARSSISADLLAGLGGRIDGNASWSEDVMATIEDRALWSRFGL